MELKLLVNWMVSTTSSGSQVIEGWLPFQENYPGIKLFGSKLFEDASQLRDRKKQPVLNGDLPRLMAAIVAKGELTLEMTFKVQYKVNVNGYGFANNRIMATWAGSDGSCRQGSFGPFNYNVKGEWVSVPQWYFEDTETYFDIMQGGLVGVFKNLVEHNYRLHVGEVQASLIDEYKKRSKKKRLTKKLAKELWAMEQTETGHNAMCTTCGMWCVSKKLEGGDERTYACALNVFAPFTSSEITSDLCERNGVTQEGGQLKSIQGDSRWSWNEVKDEVLSQSEFLRLCRLIDRESCSWLGTVEEGFSMLEFIWDDVLWIEHLSKRGLFDSCTDLDELIKEHRDKLVRKLQHRYAKNYPAYAELFMQVAVTDTYSQDAVMDITMEEVGEKAHTVPMSAFLNSYILRPCGLGFKGIKTKDGKFRMYLHRGYPMPTEAEFGMDVL